MKKWCGSARGDGAAMRDSRLAMRTTAPDRAAEGKQRDREERERENGKRESKVIYELRRESGGI